MRRLATFGAAAALSGLALANLDELAVQTANPRPPVPAGHPAILDARPVTAPDGTRRLGPCWRREHRGQHVLYLEGDPFSAGYCNGVLTGAEIAAQERALQHVLESLVPSRLARHALIRGVLLAYRGVPAALTDSERLEIAGIAAGYPDPLHALGPAYGRIVYYHAIHDISQAMVDNPIVACSAFAATRAATADGHTLIARDFDFEGDRVFDEDKVVLFDRPEAGIPFASVIWAGMAGAVTGLNAAGVGVVLNAAGSASFATSGTPTTLLVRQILEQATSVSEAVAIVERAQVFVADILTIADGERGEVAVVELAPGGRVRVRHGDGLIYATNHFLDPEMAADPENQRRMREGTTVSRFERLAELAGAGRGHLDPASAAAILRDRRLPGGQGAGLGHRGTIDALIAAHAVVLDVTARRLWVSRAPHTLGELVEYRLDEVLAGTLADHGALPADPLLASGAFARFEEARALLEASRRQPLDAGLASVRRALELAPGHPPLLLRLAELTEARGDRAAAAAAYRAYLAASPPEAKEARRARARLDALEGPG